MTMLDGLILVTLALIIALALNYPRQAQILSFICGVFASIVWLIIKIGLVNLALAVVAIAIGLALAYAITRIPVLFIRDIEKQAKK